MALDPVKRELEVLQLLDIWPRNNGGVLIGGYAIDAYGKPRYSDDIDLVIPASSEREIIDWLSEHQFKIEKYSVPNPQNYEGKTFRYLKGSITLDILVGCVRDREAKVDIPEKWITKDTRYYRLFLLNGSTRSEIPVARPEALWALKLQAGRDQDMTDLFSIMKVPVRSGDVKDLFVGIWTDSLKTKLKMTLAKTDEEKIYEDSMSRLGMKQSEQSATDWQRFQSRIQAMIPQI